MRVRFWLAFGVAGGVWVYCLAIHLSVVLGRVAAPAIPAFVAAVAGLLLAGWAFWPRRADLRRSAEVASPPRSVQVFWTACILCALWPMAVGPGVAGAGLWAGGVTGGPEGGRYLHSHARHLRAISEDEYQRVQHWREVQHTAMAVAFAGVGPMLLLSLRCPPHVSEGEATAAAEG